MDAGYEYDHSVNAGYTMDDSDDGPYARYVRYTHIQLQHAFFFTSSAQMRIRLYYFLITRATLLSVTRCTQLQRVQ